MEPPARFELATSSLPMRCYTPKPRWQWSAHRTNGYNRFVNWTSPDGSEHLPTPCIGTPAQRVGRILLVDQNP